MRKKYKYLSALLLPISLLIFYRHEIIWLFQTWIYEGYDSYGYIALIAFVLYCWKNKFSLKRGDIRILYVLFTVCLISIFIKRLDINIISALMLITALSLLLYYYFNEGMRQNWTSLLLLFLMIPWTHHINIFAGFTLRRISTLIAASILRLYHIQADVQGTMLFLGDMRLEVGAPCSGSKYLFFTAFFLIIMGLFIRQKSLLFLPLSLAVAMGCNILRIVSIALLRIFLQGEEGMFFHNIIGLFYFSIALTGVYLLCRKITELKLPWLS